MLKKLEYYNKGKGPRQIMERTGGKNRLLVDVVVNTRVQTKVKETEKGICGNWVKHYRKIWTMEEHSDST